MPSACDVVAGGCLGTWRDLWGLLRVGQKDHRLLYFSAVPVAFCQAPGDAALLISLADISKKSSSICLVTSGFPDSTARWALHG
jgi:hypothetical protein